MSLPTSDSICLITSKYCTCSMFCAKTLKHKVYVLCCAITYQHLLEKLLFSVELGHVYWSIFWKVLDRATCILFFLLVIGDFVQITRADNLQTKYLCNHRILHVFVWACAQINENIYLDLVMLKKPTTGICVFTFNNIILTM